MGFFSWDTVLYELLQHESFPEAVVLHELLQGGSLPWFTVLQTVCYSVDVRRVTGPASKSAPVWAPLSTGPQVPLLQ